MDMFEYMRQENMKQEAPLAKRMRPTRLEEVVGQEHIRCFIVPFRRIN